MTATTTTTNGNTPAPPATPVPAAPADPGHQDPDPPTDQGSWWLRAVLVAYHVLLAWMSVQLLFGVLPLVERIPLNTPKLMRVLWPGPDFVLTATGSLLVIGALGGLLGSLIQTMAILASRLGRHTFEPSYTTWYLLRPFGAVLLAVIFVAALRIGAVTLSVPADTAAGVLVFLLAGGLAGLFSDRVLAMLRATLGATSTEKPASAQAVPHAAPPVAAP